jgi:hypothetical protein
VTQPHSCTACPRIPSSRWPQRSSTAPRRLSGSRPPTGCPPSRPRSTRSSTALTNPGMSSSPVVAALGGNALLRPRRADRRRDAAAQCRVRQTSLDPLAAGGPFGRDAPEWAAGRATRRPSRRLRRRGAVPAECTRRRDRGHDRLAARAGTAKRTCPVAGRHAADTGRRGPGTTMPSSTRPSQSGPPTTSSRPPCLHTARVTTRRAPGAASRTSVTPRARARSAGRLRAR